MIIDVLKSILYGIIEGITEWLPISSTGHIILATKFIPFTDVSENFFSMYEVVIQLGAILAVVLLFWNKLWPLHSAGYAKKNQVSVWKMDTLELWLKVIVACIPSAVLGLIVDDFLDTYLYNYITVAVTLILYGIFFIIVERSKKAASPLVNSLEALDYKTAFIIGAFQVLAMIPGTSRSGATILGAILLGCARPVAAEFSFFLAVPTMFGASFLKLLKFLLKSRVDLTETFLLLVGMVVSFAVSVVAIRTFMNYVRKKDFSVFGYYRIALGIVVILCMALL